MYRNKQQQQQQQQQQQYLMEQQYINEYYKNYQASQYRPQGPQGLTLSYSKQHQNLKRLNSYNNRLKEQLQHPTVLVSVAAASLIKFCTTNYDPLIPKAFDNYDRKIENPFTVKKNASCNCTIL